MTPLLTVVITTYNRVDFIAKAIESVLLQTFPEFELIVVDNASDDGSDLLISSYVKSDSRIKYYRNAKNLGMIENYRRATNLVRGEYVTYLSSDDYFLDTRVFELAVDYLECSDVVLVHGRNMIDDRLLGSLSDDLAYRFYKDTYYRCGRVDRLEVLRRFPDCHTISFGGTFFRFSKFKGLKLFSPGVYSFDIQLALQLLSKGDPYFMDVPTYAAVRHRGSLTSSLAKFATYRRNMRYIHVAVDHFERTGHDGLFDVKKWELRMCASFLKSASSVLFQTVKGERGKILEFARRKSGYLLLAVVKHIIILITYRGLVSILSIIKLRSRCILI